MSTQPKSPNRPTLENLLELKRRERPPEAFWNQFDARLREKQLAALIPVASPIARWSVLFGRFAKFGLPVAAAAAVAVGVVTLNRQGAVVGGPIVRDGQDRQSEVLKAQVVAESAVPASVDNDHPASTIQTVVIEAGPTVAAVESKRSTYREEALNTDEITRTLPWLADVNVKREGALTGLHLTDPLSIEKGPTQLAVNAFEQNNVESQPVWAPTQQNIRDAVASEVGLAPSYGTKAQRAWMTRVIAANDGSQAGGSRVEAEYPRELSRVGLTASTLSIKF